MHDLVEQVLLSAKWLVHQAQKTQHPTIHEEDCLMAILRIEPLRNKLYSTVHKDILETASCLPFPDCWKSDIEGVVEYNFSIILDSIVDDTASDLDAFLKLIGEKTSADDFGIRANFKQLSSAEVNNATSDSTAWVQSVASVSHALKATVVGQEHAIEAVCDGLIRKIYRTNADIPMATFLFMGAPATGKTLLASSLADALGGDWKTTSVQMETMLADNQGFSINGLSKGYQTAAPGLVTDFVRQHPRSVVIFENFDKAHPNTRSIVEPLLTTGVLVDQHGFFELKEDGKFNYSKRIADSAVSFKESIIIFTTNAGDSAYDSLGFQQLLKHKREQIAPVLLNALGRTGNETSRNFPPVSKAFIAGLAAGTVTFFENLSLDALVTCAEKNIQSALSQLQKGLGCAVSCASESLVSKALLLSFCPHVNVLTTGNDLVGKLVDPVMDYIRAHEGEVPKCVNIRFAVGEEEKLQSILETLGSDPLKLMFRKNQALRLSFTTCMEDDTLDVALGGFTLQQISHAHDFQGVGAIQVEVPEVGFKDIAGHHVVKKRMEEVVKMLQRPQDVKALGVDVPKGMLLWGPPGTGKTLLAKALAHEAELPFIATTGSELLDLDLMQTIFKRARKYAPSILFIDEIDAIGARGSRGAHFDVIINQLLIEIDGFDTRLSSPVFIIAATNLPEKIDAALLRSGRIDLKVEVPMLDKDARAYFVDQYFSLPHDGSLDREGLLSYTSGMSGADLEKVKRETTLAMFSSTHDQITMAMLVEQINTIKYGVRLTHKKLLQSLHATAYHEAGHAIVSLVLNPDMLIEQVTVMPRANALGFVSYEPESVVHRQVNRKEVLDSMCVALAGRMAQSRQFPEHGDDSGASSDLQKATSWASHAICQLGMDEEVGNVVLLSQDQMPLLAEGGMVFERVKVWIQEAEELCAEVVEQHWDAIDRLAQQLIQDEVVAGDALRRDFSCSRDA